MQIYEKNLHEARRWLCGDIDDGVLIHRELKIGSSFRKRVADKMDQAFNVIASLKEKFDLERTDENMAGALRAEFNASWVDMCDRDSANLKGYGEVNPALKKELDPSIHQLASLAIQIALIFQEGEGN